MGGGGKKTARKDVQRESCGEQSQLREKTTGGRKNEGQHFAGESMKTRKTGLA